MDQPDQTHTLANQVASVPGRPGLAPPSHAADAHYAPQAAAHDINNLLQVIVGCCERLKFSASPEQHEELDHITVAAEHAAALSSRVLRTGVATTLVAMDLPAVLFRLEGLLSRIAGARVALTVLPPPPGTRVRMHEGDLVQILVNLTVNARDAMPEGGSLTIEAGMHQERVPSAAIAGEPAARYVRFQITDTGVGMTADVRERVFERFFTTKKGEGTGHGLATVHAIVEQYGGSIELRSEPGEGAAFLILLPILESSVPQIEAARPDAGAKAVAATSPGGTAGALVDTLPVPVFMVQRGRFIYVNGAFATLLGVPASQLIDRSCVERVQPDDRELFPVEPRHPGGHVSTAEAAQVRVRCGDGSERSLRLATVPVLRGGSPGLLGVAIDVTLQPDTAMVAARMAALGRLAGGVAHDYNNLLLVMGGHVERLRNALASDSALLKDVDAIAAAAGRAGTLTDNLLSFGRRQLLAPEVMDLATLARAVTTERLSVLGSGIELHIVVDPELPAVEADSSRFREVLWHLIENAREAMPSGGTLTLSLDTTTVDRSLQQRWAFLTEGALFVRLRVIDTGRGMAPAVAAHAFEPFFTTKGKGRGAGMGLASVYGLVKQSGGFVFAERTGDDGTCMTVLLPPAARHAAIAPAASPNVSPRAHSSPRNRILLVEDDDGVRELLQDLLQSHGYEVRAAASAESAQEAADREFDLLLTDLDLPGMDGARLAALLTRQQPQLNVIVMSGYPDDGTLDGSLGGRPAFLRKPFSSAVLLAQIEHALAVPDGSSDQDALGSATRAS